MALAAPLKYRTTHLPASSRGEIEREVPFLLPLISEERDDLRVYTKSSPHFDAVSNAWNLNNKAKPLAIARCSSTSAVQSIVELCASLASQSGKQVSEIPLVVRSGGHDAFGRSVVEGSLMLDVRGLDQITISTDRESVTIGGGVSSKNLIKFLDEHGLITPSGYCTSVGHVGWAAGGGYGVLAGGYGLGVDQILGATLVDATGRLVDTDEDSELLWAIRGAGTGNFGVVVSMRIRVYERPAFLGGMILYPASETNKVMNGLQKLIEESGYRDEFSGDCSLAQIPGLGAVFAIFFAWAAKGSDAIDPLDQARQCLKECEGLGTVLVNTVNETTPAAFMSTMDPMTENPIIPRLKTFTVSGLSPKLASILSDSPAPTPTCMVIAHRSHGVATFPHPTRYEDPVTRDSCMPIRDPHTVIAITGAVLPGDEDGLPAGSSGESEKAGRWVDAISSGILEAGISMQRTYVSWTSNEEANALQLYGEATGQRLKKLKQVYDGMDLFSSAYPKLA